VIWAIDKLSHTLENSYDHDDDDDDDDDDGDFDNLFCYHFFLYNDS